MDPVQPVVLDSAKYQQPETCTLNVYRYPSMYQTLCSAKAVVAAWALHVPRSAQTWAAPSAKLNRYLDSSILMLLFFFSREKFQKHIFILIDY